MTMSSRQKYLKLESEEIIKELNLKVGDIYDDCRYHPMLCIKIDLKEDQIKGISLITGHVGSCSIAHCGINKLTIKQAVYRKTNWKAFLHVLQKKNKKHRLK